MNIKRYLFISLLLVLVSCVSIERQAQATVTTTTTRVSYTGDGSQKTYIYTFRILKDTDIEVYVNDTKKTLTTDYTVTGVDSVNGGTVVFTTAPLAGETIFIVRNTSPTQEVDYQPYDPFPAETHEKALDKLAITTQDILESVGRSIKFKKTSTKKDIVFPEPVAGKYLRWDDNGTALMLDTEPTVSAVTSAWVDARDYDSFSDAVDAINTAEKTLVVSTEMSVPASKNVPLNITLHFMHGGSLNIASGQTVTIQGSVIAGYHQRIFKGSGKVTFGPGSVYFLYAEWWGAIADDNTDNTVALQETLNCAARSGVNIKLLSGVYRYTKLYCYYDAVNNPGWPNDTAIQGRVTVYGTGMMHKNNYTSSIKKTILRSTDATGPGIEVAYVGNKNVIAIRFEDLTVIADNTTQVMNIAPAHSGSGLEDAFLVQEGSGDGLQWEGIWLSELRNISVLKADLDRVGKGVIVKNTTTVNTDGQLVKLDKVKSEGFDTGFILGSEDYDTSKLLAGVEMSGCNAKDCTNGLFIGTVENSIISTFQTEGDYTEIGIKLGNHAKNIRIIGCRLPAKQKAIAIGYGSAASASDAAAAANIYIYNNYIIGKAPNYYGIYINNSDGIGGSYSSMHTYHIYNNRIFRGDAGNTNTTGIGIEAASASINMGGNTFTSLATNIDNPYYAKILEGNNGFDHFYFDSLLIDTGTSTPSSGKRTWNVGDFILKRDPTPASPKAAVCITQGDPGTWTVFNSSGGTTANRPVLTANDYVIYFDTDLNKAIVWNGSLTTWVNIDGSSL